MVGYREDQAEGGPVRSKVRSVPRSPNRSDVRSCVDGVVGEGEESNRGLVRDVSVFLRRNEPKKLFFNRSDGERLSNDEARSGPDPVVRGKPERSAWCVFGSGTR